MFSAEYSKVLAEFEDLRSKNSLSIKDARILAARFDAFERARVDDAEDWEEWLAIYPDKNRSPLEGQLAVPHQIEGDGDLQLFLKHDDLWELARLEGETVDQLILDSGFRVNRQSRAYEELLRHVCHTRVRTEFHAMRRFKGDWGDAYVDPMADKKLSSEIDPEPSRLTSSVPASSIGNYNLKRLIEDYIEHKSSAWGDSAKLDAPLILGTFEQFIGSGVDPETITREQLRQFRALLSRLPLRYSNSSKFKGMSLTQIASLADVENLKKPSEQTVHKKFTYIGGLLGFGLLEEKVSRNRAEGLNPKSENSSHAVVYTEAELVSVFKYFNDRSDKVRYWIPRIALCGFRQNEICQLRRSSFKKRDGIPYIELNKDTQVKNRNSLRRVPVPQWLVDIGLLDFVDKSENEELFEIRAASYSKSFNKELRKVLARGNFHSFRHTFRAYCRRDGVAKEMADYIGGWRSNEFTTGDQYGTDFTLYLDRLRRELNKLNYPPL